LTGLDEVNYHTLADFRVEKQEELDELFTQVLAALSKERLITLEQVMQDGTKIRAVASPRSYQWESSIREHWDRARRRVAEMGDPRNDEGTPRVKQARARAQRERQERLGKALGELEKLREKKPGKGRISVTEPEARRMKLPDGGLALGYNALRGCGTRVDCGCRGNTGSQRHGPVASRGGTHRRTVAAKAGADGGRRGLHHASGHRRDGRTKDRFSWEYASRRRDHGEDRSPPAASECFRHNNKKRGVVTYLYEAKISDCQPCVHKQECCPENQSRGRGILRLEENAAVQAFRQKMETEEARANYRRRGRVVEFCHAWIKSKLGLRQFHVRGLRKVQMEMLWACLTYNLQHWIRLNKLQPAPEAT
jgi:hypothetical protein